MLCHVVLLLDKPLRFKLIPRLRRLVCFRRLRDGKLAKEPGKYREMKIS